MQVKYKENVSSHFNNSEYSTRKTQDGVEAAGEKCDWKQQKKHSVGLRTEFLPTDIIKEGGKI